MPSRISSRFGRPATLRPTFWEILRSARYTIGRKTALRCGYSPRCLLKYGSWLMKASHAAACSAGLYVVLPTVSGRKFISLVLRDVDQVVVVGAVAVHVAQEHVAVVAGGTPLEVHAHARRAGGE